MDQSNLWSAIVVASNNHSLDGVLAAIDALPLEDKQQVLKHLLSTTPMNLILGGSGSGNDCCADE
ncbi:hypothetical protein HC928_20500 [bacterium]|nr:hypothetical protein [bacterium]